MPEQNSNEQILARVDEHRRGFLKRVLGASFAVPLIASFSVETILTGSANAGPTSCANTTFMGNTTYMANTTSIVTCPNTVMAYNNQPDVNDPLFLELLWRGDGR